MNYTFPQQTLSWNKPLLPQVVDWLLKKAADTIPLDLGHFLVITPTRQSGRRLQEALVSNSSQSGLLPPLILTPETLLLKVTSKANIASQALVLATWSALLQEISLEHYRNVFPVDPIKRDPQWALRIARQLEQLQARLCEHNLNFGAVANKVADTNFEPDRWKELASLEQQFLQKLNSSGYQCPHQAKRAAASSPSLPASIRHIVLACTPDPSPLALLLLNNVREKNIQVTVLNYGPTKRGFNAWLSDGRPDFKAWAERDLVFSDHIRPQVTHDCKDLAEKAFQLLIDRSKADTPPALGTLDPDFIPAIQYRLQQTGLSCYDPVGVDLLQTEPGRVLQRLQDFALQRDFFPVWNLLRDPAFQSHVLKLQPKDHESFLRDLDRVQAEHLCHSAESMQALLDQHRDKFHWLRKAWDILKQWQQSFRTCHFEKALEEILLVWFGDQWLSETDPQDRELIDALRGLSALLQEMQALRTVYPELTTAEAHSLIHSLARETKLYPERPDPAIDLQGWLELLWEDSPSLILAGFHEGIIPSHIQGDSFLPETLLRFLGMTSNADRLGRDAYLLHALSNSRRKGGSLDILIARWAPSGSALRPSKILFRTADDADFLQRVEILIKEDPPRWHAPARQLANAVFLPPMDYQEKTLSVTAFRQYLANPFDFYLQNYLKWNAYPIRKTEMDALDFGNLFHRVMHRVISEGYHLQANDAQALENTLIDLAAEEMQRQFAGDYSFPVRLQWENLKTRLRQCAKIDTNLREEGWQTIATETKVEYKIGDWNIHGTIDRIDYNQSENSYLIIDYKTGKSQGDDVKTTHIKGVKSNSPDPVTPAARFTIQARNGAKEVQWVDLQLPLYALAANYQGLLGEDSSEQTVQLAYYRVPPSAEKVALTNKWEITQQELESAQQCAAEILQLIETHHFSESPETNHFKSYFPDGLNHILPNNSATC